MTLPFTEVEFRSCCRWCFKYLCCWQVAVGSVVSGLCSVAEQGAASQAVLGGLWRSAGGVGGLAGSRAGVTCPGGDGPSPPGHWARGASPPACQALVPAQSQSKQQVPVPALTALCGGCNRSWDMVWPGAHPDPITPCLGNTGFLQTLQKPWQKTIQE